MSPAPPYCSCFLEETARPPFFQHSFPSLLPIPSLPLLPFLPSPSSSFLLSSFLLLPCTGKCYVVSNQKSLAQCMESLTQKLHPGVVINFQKIGGVSPPSSSTAHAAREATPMETDEKGTYTCTQTMLGAEYKWASLVPRPFPF